MPDVVEKVVADDAVALTDVFVPGGVGAGGTGYGGLQPTTTQKPETGTPQSDQQPGGGHSQSTERPVAGGGVIIDPRTRDKGGGGPGTTERPADGGGGPQNDTGPDCDEISRQMAALLATLEAIHESNRDRTKKAVQAVKGNPASKTYDGYAHWITQAKITQAQVDGANAAGKWMIDIGLFAMGGWGGLGALGKGSSIARSTATGMQVARVGEGGALTFSKWHEVAQTASKLDKWLGTGIRGSKSTAEAYSKVATKILEKVSDEVGPMPGMAKGYTSTMKTVEKLDKEWWQGGLGLGESLARGAIVDGIGNWMKEGASAPAMDQAKKDYAEFAAQAAAANVDAATALGIEAKLRELAELAGKKNCTVPRIPNHNFYTFDVAQFGVGMSKGDKGPSLHLHSLEGNVEGNWDLFVQAQQTPFG